MNNLKFFFIASILTVFCIYHSSAQFVQYSNGAPVKTNRYTEVQGSLFLVDDWSTGTVKIESGKVYDGIFLKYDQLEDQIYYKGNDNELMAFNDPIKEFVFTNFKGIPDNNILFRNGYPPLQNTNAKSYFEVLADGKTQFLKRIVKQITESKEYNSAIVNRSFVESSKYYLFLNGQLIVVKKDKKSLLGALSNKEAELNNYISNNSLNLKEESNIVKLITYYNSIDKS